MISRSNIIVTLAVLLVTNCSSIDGIALDCTYGMVSFNTVGSVYSCIGRVLFDGNENVTTVYGNHQTGKTHQHVLGLSLRTQNLPFFPTNIESFFPNTIGIDLYDSTVTSITKRHLDPFPNLGFLSLSGNKITTIDGDLFDRLDSLTGINFSRNDIRHVGHDLNLLLRATMSFVGNPCISESASTPDEVASLKLNLLRNCPPTISQIEDSLEKRQNLFTRIDGQVQSLITKTDEMNGEISTLRNDQVDLWHVAYTLHNRIAYLEGAVGSKFEDKSTVPFLIDGLGKKGQLN